ncbi:hypothetical protein V3C99_007389 [Haemonchus contortus]
MESGSVFDFSGSAKMMRLKVTLIEKGLNANSNGMPTESLTGTSINRTVDELNLQWQQKVSSHYELGNIQQDSTRAEPRLFTYVEGETLPERFKSIGIPSSSAEIAPKTGYEKWMAHNAVIDLPLRRNHRAIRCDKKVMYIMAYLGSLSSSYDQRDEYVVCRITLLNERSLIFEPRLTLDGYRIQSKMGEYIATVQIWDDYFTPMVDQFNKVSLVPPIPETQQFEVPDEGSTKFVSMLCIEYAEDFDYENVWIEYMTYFPSGVTCTSNNTEGQTSACSMDEDGRFHFSFTIELDFTAADISSFHVRFRVRSEDFWGRQYLAGYGSLTPLLRPGRTDYRVECWRPIKPDDPVSELREFFIGQAIDIDFFNLKEDGVISRAGMTTQSSGTLHVSVTNVLQRRDYITKETLNHMKYGAMFDRMGMRSDLYWRIMKVLMEFEEAKRQLLELRAAQ